MTNRDRRNPQKIYLKVRADHLPDGRIVPLMFRAGEDETVRIDRIEKGSDDDSLPIHSF